MNPLIKALIARYFLVKPTLTKPVKEKIKEIEMLFGPQKLKDKSDIKKHGSKV